MAKLVDAEHDPELWNKSVRPLDWVQKRRALRRPFSNTGGAPNALANTLFHETKLPLNAH